MCNCYTGFNFGQSGYGCNTSTYNTCGGGYGGCAKQTLCRDCCGNLRMAQTRMNCCGCHNLCGCNTSADNGTSTQNGNGQTNGRFTCVTFCGTNNNGASTASAGDLYYARQYGLYPYGCYRSCGCSLDVVNET